MSSTCKITVKGYTQAAGSTEKKNVTLATFNNLSTASVRNYFGNMESGTLSENAINFLKAVQAVTSAYVTGFTITETPTVTEITWEDERGDELDISEIIKEEYADSVTMTPTLNMQNATMQGKTVNFNVRYMADPLNTENFNTKVITLASRLGGFSSTAFIAADMTFTARDEITRAE